MTLRSRLVLAAAAAVAVGVVVASVIVFFLVRGELRASIDRGLEKKAAHIADGPLAGGPGERSRLADRGRRPLPDEPGHYLQLVDTAGVATRPRRETPPLPVSTQTRDVAAGRADAFFSEAHVRGVHVRMLTAPVAAGGAVQVTRPMTEVDDQLAQIKLWLFLVALGGVATAVLIGLLVARAALTPLKKLTKTAEYVTRTRDLRSRIDVDSGDELGRLAVTLNTMLEALEQALDATERAVRSQRQLVADASHELSTPLTSLRTNIELLLRSDELPRRDREEIARDVIEQLAEMSHLIDELVELAHGDEQPFEPEEVRLDVVVDDAVARILRGFPQVDVVADVRPTVVMGMQPLIARAVTNLLENAAKWSPADRPVEVRVADGSITVRDHGPGIAKEDLPHVFDRFYRARNARRTPGSGLGLAIVKQVAEAHGGSVSAEAPPGGGTLMRLTLPLASRDVDTRRRLERAAAPASEA
jgi:two-component system, OmpR family, sensor histidine kinase MprB